MNIIDLEEGIFVFIYPAQLELLKRKIGFIEKDNYPDSCKEKALETEIGRYQFFRFLRGEK